MEILKEQYEKEVVPALMKKFNYKSVMEVQKLDKIVINIGLGDIKENPKELENAISELTQITGQKPITTKSKKKLSDDELTKYIYRGMPIKLDNTTLIFSGRDVGNFAAGYISGKKGVSWQETRWGFDLYQQIKNPANPIEGMTSQLAQIKGYKYIENTSHARIMRYWIEMMSVINSSQ